MDVSSIGGFLSNRYGKGKKLTKLETPLKIQPAFLILAAIISILIGIVSNVAPDLMLAVLAVLLWVFSLLLLIRLGSFKVFSPAGLFFIFYTLFMYIGGLYLFFTNGDDAPFSTGQRNYQFYLAITLGLLAFSAGTFFSNLYTKYKPKEETARFRQKPWRDNLKGASFALSLGVLTLIAVAFTLIYVQSRGVLPLLQVLADFGGDVYRSGILARLQFTGYGEGIASYFYQGYFGQFYRVVLPFAALFALAKYLFTRNKRWLVCWLALSLIAAFFLLLSLQRWPILMFLILTFLLYQFYQLKIQKKPLILVAIFSAIAYFSVTYIRGLTGLTRLLRDFSRRIALSEVTGMYSVFELFPNHEEFRYGGFFLVDLWNVLPGPGEGSSRWLRLVLFPGSPPGTSTTMGTIGGLYADFGLIGTVIGMLIFGFLLQLALIWFVRSQKSLIALVLLSFLTMAAGWLSFGGVIGALFLCLIGAIICAIVIIVLNSLLKIRTGGTERSVI